VCVCEFVHMHLCVCVHMGLCVLASQERAEVARNVPYGAAEGDFGTLNLLQFDRSRGEISNKQRHGFPKCLLIYLLLLYSMYKCAKAVQHFGK